MYNSDNYVHYNYGDNGGKRGPSVGAWIAIGIVVVFFISIFSVFGSCISTYNNLVEMEENVKLEFANVQTAMQSRLEKIPDLVKVTDEAAKHIENIIGDVAEARKSLGNCSTPEELEAKDAEITNKINELLVVVEQYPTITASEQYSSLMYSIEGAANRVNVARENYNAAVSEYNRTVRRFPGSLLANIFGFDTMELFEADEEANNSSLVDFDKD